MPRDPEVAFGVAAIVSRPTPYTNAMYEPQTLLIHRCGEPPAEGAGTYSVPGGWLDDGESIVGAACRETLEEVGLQCAPFPGTRGAENRGVTTHRSATTGLWCVTVYVNVIALSDEPVLNEPSKVDEAFWVTRREFHRTYADRLFEPDRLAVEQGVLH